MDIPQFPLFFPFIKMLAVAGFSFAFISIRMLKKKKKNTSVDIHVWISCCLCIRSLGYVPRSKIAGLYGIHVFNLIDIANIFAKVF